ncbi:MAG TPA: hypothetical protein VHV49_09125 [Pseudonocardiaceae bacterium]|nr:hypothetical protein [Pseudonocardiaceae bacterium]
MSDPSRPTRWWIAPVLGVVVLVTAVAAVVAHGLYHRAPVLTPIRVATGTSSAVPTGSEPGSGAVSVTPDVLRDPVHSDVQRVLQRYFDAINERRYDDWRSVVTETMAAQKTRQSFLAGYESTRDGSILVYRVDRALDGSLRVLLTFHSIQSLADAPADHQSGCLVWQVVYPMTFDTQDAGWKVDAGAAATSPQISAC